MIDEYIAGLAQYGIDRGLISADDRRYIVNRFLEILGLDSFDPAALPINAPLEDLLNALTDFAVSTGAVGDTQAQRKRFETKLMGVMTPYPHEVNEKFAALYAQSPQKATDWFYALAKNSNYIRAYRTAMDVKWVTDTHYGPLEITINLAKPEKDPRDIAAQGRASGAGEYPACLLCRENEGYAGREGRPARQNLRVVPVTLAGESWGMQYSPYVYYNEHCIVLNDTHRHMVIDRGAIDRLLDFVRQFPHYFIGSNADLPIVGGSILSHDHFQGGRHEMPMAKAPIETPLCFSGFEDVHAGIVRWPMSVIRLTAKDPGVLAELAEKILTVWRSYTDASAGVFAETPGERHNTVTPIARRRGESYELDMVLRNNLTTAEHPLGVFHPHEELHHIKKENIGLIEVMGLAILPGRLKKEMDGLKAAIISGGKLESDPELSKHAPWVKEFLPKYPAITKKDAEPILRREIGLVFEKVLLDAGVFKRDQAGREAFLRFIDAVNKKDAL